MTRALVAFAAVLPMSLASAQGTSHTHHRARAEPNAAVPGVPAAATARTEKGAGPAVGDVFRSAFADYRPFSEEVVAKDWRMANDEVRDAGGHIGLMKGEPARLHGHDAHGSKQPPAADRK